MQCAEKGGGGKAANRRLKHAMGYWRLACSNFGKMLRDSMRGLISCYLPALLVALLLSGCAQEQPPAMAVKGVKLSGTSADFEKLGNRPHAPYPEAARQRGIQGWVKLVVEVRRDGTVSNVRVVNNAPPELAKPVASHVARHWRYSPQTDPSQPELREFNEAIEFRMAPAK